MSNRIKQVSTETENAMLRKSAFGLPNRPSESGMKADDIKKAFYKSLIDSENSLLSELKRVVAEANTILAEIDSYASGHSSDKSNPHSVTKSQVGLGNVDNTSDANKPVSNATKTELDKKVNYTDIQDNYTSIATNKPLSANRGRLLYNQLTSVESKANASVKTISLNSETGVLTITKTDGTSLTIDLPLEFLVKSGYYNASSKEILLVLDNDTTIKIPVADLVNEYYGDESTISMYVDSSDNNKVKFKISDTYKSKIDTNTSKRHEHSNKALLDTYTQTEANLKDAVSKKHSHSNSSVLDATTASFTTAKDSALTKAIQDIADLDGRVTQGGTIIYDSGTALSSFNLEEIVFSAISCISDSAEYANRCKKGGEIDRRLKALENK